MVKKITKITVNVSSSYDVIVGHGLLDDCSEEIKSVVTGQKIAIITDDIVDKLYADRVENSLKNAGFEVCKFVFLHGEKQKSSSTLNNVYAFLAESQITRTDTIIALGGGVVGDLSGYAAATYLRGVGFIQMPTTLLAQIDSSVGGKTAIDIEQGKNLVGAFKQPLLVICDTDTLNTLSNEFFTDGMGEAIKYGMIKSCALLDKFLTCEIKQDIDGIICQCIEIKRDFVCADEFDRGDRMMLNFGHTLGHAIEKYYNYTGISHGRAISIGMVLITRLAQKANLCSIGVVDRLVSCLELYGLPTTTDIPIGQLAKFCFNDKKRENSSINIIICSDVGKAFIKKFKIEEFCGFVGE